MLASHLDTALKAIGRESAGEGERERIARLLMRRDATAIPRRPSRTMTLQSVCVCVCVLYSRVRVVRSPAHPPIWLSVDDSSRRILHCDASLAGSQSALRKRATFQQRFLIRIHDLNFAELDSVCDYEGRTRRKRGGSAECAFRARRNFKNRKTCRASTFHPVPAPREFVPLAPTSPLLS